MSKGNLILLLMLLEVCCNFSTVHLSIVMSSTVIHYRGSRAEYIHIKVYANIQKPPPYTLANTRHEDIIGH